MRVEESKFTSWRYEIDRGLLWAVCIMIFIGVLAAVSAGSVAAARIGEPWYYFIKKAIVFYPLGILALFGASMLNKKWVLGLSIANVAAGLVLLGITLISPHIINGSARWVVWPFNMMPADSFSMAGLRINRESITVVLTPPRLTLIRSIIRFALFSNSSHISSCGKSADNPAHYIRKKN